MLYPHLRHLRKQPPYESAQSVVNLVITVSYLLHIYSIRISLIFKLQNARSIVQSIAQLEELKRRSVVHQGQILVTLRPFHSVLHQYQAALARRVQLSITPGYDSEMLPTVSRCIAGAGIIH